MFTKQEIIDTIKIRYKEGTRVKLIHMEDPQAPPDGTFGTVTGVDDAGHIHVKWDNGSGLSLIYGEDRFSIVEDEDH